MLLQRRTRMNRETLIIEGVRDDGSRLRPGDWVERISSMVAEFGPDHRLHYSTHVHPGVIDGRKCLVVEPALREKNPELFQYILDFARRNQLAIHQKGDGVEKETESISKEPVEL